MINSGNDLNVMTLTLPFSRTHANHLQDHCKKCRMEFLASSCTKLNFHWLPWLLAHKRGSSFTSTSMPLTMQSHLNRWQFYLCAIHSQAACMGQTRSPQWYIKSLLQTRFSYVIVEDVFDYYCQTMAVAAYTSRLMIYFIAIRSV